MRRYRSNGSERLRDLLLDELAAVVDRHAAGLDACEPQALADVRGEVTLVLAAAERAPEHFAGLHRALRRRRNAVASREAAVAGLEG